MGKAPMSAWLPSTARSCARSSATCAPTVRPRGRVLPVPSRLPHAGPEARLAEPRPDDAAGGRHRPHRPDGLPGRPRPGRALRSRSLRPGRECRGGRVPARRDPRAVERGGPVPPEHSGRARRAASATAHDGAADPGEASAARRPRRSSLCQRGVSRSAPVSGSLRGGVGRRRGPPQRSSAIRMSSARDREPARAGSSVPGPRAA